MGRGVYPEPKRAETSFLDSRPPGWEKTRVCRRSPQRVAVSAAAGDAVRRGRLQFLEKPKSRRVCVRSWNLGTRPRRAPRCSEVSSGCLRFSSRHPRRSGCVWEGQVTGSGNPRCRQGPQWVQKGVWQARWGQRRARGAGGHVLASCPALIPSSERKGRDERRAGGRGVVRSARGCRGASRDLPGVFLVVGFSQIGPLSLMLRRRRSRIWFCWKPARV